MKKGAMSTEPSILKIEKKARVLNRHFKIIVYLRYIFIKYTCKTEGLLICDHVLQLARMTSKLHLISWASCFLQCQVAKLHYIIGSNAQPSDTHGYLNPDGQIVPSLARDRRYRRVMHKETNMVEETIQWKEMLQLGCRFTTYSSGYNFTGTVNTKIIFQHHLHWRLIKQLKF